MSNMGGAGFCGIMEHPNMLVMDRDVQSIMASSWYSAASASYSGALSGHLDNHYTRHRCQHHYNGK